jgi:hypothetical protein
MVVDGGARSRAIPRITAALLVITVHPVCFYLAFRAAILLFRGNGPASRPTILRTRPPPQPSHTYPASPLSGFLMFLWDSRCARHPSLICFIILADLKHVRANKKITEIPIKIFNDNHNVRRVSKLVLPGNMNHTHGMTRIYESNTNWTSRSTRRMLYGAPCSV